MNKTMRLFFVVLILTAFTTIWTGCNNEDNYVLGSITGVVSDAATGEPIKNANVKLKPRGETTLTGTDGAFQFSNIPDGTYSLFISKNGYEDLDDDYVIWVGNGTSVRRDVQLSSAFGTFSLSVNGEEVNSIDFGNNYSFSTLQVSVLNNGSTSISEIQFTHSANWIKYPSPSFTLNDIEPYTGKSFDVEIDRSKLNIGDNTSYISVSSGFMTKKLNVKAQGIGVPSVLAPSFNNNGNFVTVTSYIGDKGGGEIIDKGFEYAYISNPSQSSTISLGPGGEYFTEFHAQIQTNGNDINIRAFANNGVHIGYSEWVRINNNAWGSKTY